MPHGAPPVDMPSQRRSRYVLASVPGVGEPSVVVAMTDIAAARSRWANALIRRAPNPPRYGSREWHLLPEGSPAKVAAVVVAAECWAVDADNAEERLRRQLEAERRAFKHAEDADYQARAEEHRRRWKHLSTLHHRDTPGNRSAYSKRLAALTWPSAREHSSDRGACTAANQRGRQHHHGARQREAADAGRWSSRPLPRDRQGLGAAPRTHALTCGRSSTPGEWPTW